MDTTFSFTDAVDLSLVALIERSLPDLTDLQQGAPTKMAMASCVLFLAAHPDKIDDFKAQLAAKADGLDDVKAQALARCEASILRHLSLPKP